MIKEITIFLSSQTGNTRKVAFAIAAHLEEMGYSITIHPSEEPLPSSHKTDFSILCFWTRRTGLDDTSKQLLTHFQNTPFLAVGTLGHYPDSAHADKVRKNVLDAINASNHCIDLFLCQGAVSLTSTERRRKLSPNNPHYLNDAGYARHLASQSHPDETDLQDAISFVTDHLFHDHFFK